MTIKKILIGIDDSKHAEYAAKYGFDLARNFGAEVGLVNIVEPSVMPEMNQNADIITGMPTQGVGIEEVEIMDIQQNRSESIVSSTISNLAGDLKVTHYTEYGATADGIIECGKEFNADLIVIGTHNRSGFDRLLMGSVAESVVRHSHIPVLVVPMGKESIG